MKTMLFSFVNVGTGLVISWILTYYFVPWIFGIQRSYIKATKVTAVFTVAALIRNIIIYGMFNHA